MAQSGLLFSVGVCNATDTLSPAPNIVWIVVDDMSCHFSYQGEKRVHTPNVYRLTREGITFTKAYATTPVVLATLQDVSFVHKKAILSRS